MKWTPDPDADELRWRVELHLATSRPSEVPGAARLAQEAGVLTAEEAAAWGWRAVQRDSAPDPEPTPLPPAARNRLEALAAAIARQGPAGSDSDEWWAIQEEAGVLQQVGMLSPEEARALDDRVRRSAGLETHAEWMAEQDAIAHATQVDLLDVVIGPPSSGRLRVLELRRFPGAVHVACDGVDELRPPTLEDDVGTAYEAWSGGNGETEYRPGIPAGARLVRVRSGGEIAEVPLP